jgi:hypothetical protein
MAGQGNFSHGTELARDIRAMFGLTSDAYDFFPLVARLTGQPLVFDRQTLEK